MDDDNADGLPACHGMRRLPRRLGRRRIGRRHRRNAGRPALHRELQQRPSGCALGELPTRASPQHRRPVRRLRDPYQSTPLGVPMPARASTLDRRRELRRPALRVRQHPQRTLRFPGQHLLGARLGSKRMPRLALRRPGRHGLPSGDVGRGPRRALLGTRPLHQHEQPGIPHGRLRLLRNLRRANLVGTELPVAASET